MIYTQRARRRRALNCAKGLGAFIVLLFLVFLLRRNEELVEKLPGDGEGGLVDNANVEIQAPSADSQEETTVDTVESQKGSADIRKDKDVPLETHEEAVAKEPADSRSRKHDAEEEVEASSESKEEDRTKEEKLWLYPKADRTLQENDLRGPWFSKSKQDQLLYTGFFRRHFNGTFVEIGPGDGVSDSITKFFQDSMGWKGLLIEPSENFKWLKAGKRQAEIEIEDEVGKPRCASGVSCLDAAVCKESEVSHPVRVNTTSEASETAEADIGDAASEIPCKSLAQLLKESGIKRIDVLSIRGKKTSASTALETMDWKVPVHILLLQELKGDLRDTIISTLKRNGFEFLGQHGSFAWWVNPKNSSVKMT